MTSAYHPQSDGQSEIVNKIITMYLRCLTGDRPKEWIRWFPWAEFCYNIAYHKSIRTTLFKLVYGCDPPQLKTYSPGDVVVPSVDDLLTEHDQFWNKQRYVSNSPRITTTNIMITSTRIDHSKSAIGCGLN